MKAPLLRLVSRLCLTSFLALLPRPAAAAPAEVPVPSAAEILSTLQRDHPRLLVSAEDLQRLTRRVQENATLKDWHAKLAERGRRILEQPPSKYEIPDGLRLLATSRRVLDRVYTLALLFRLDADPRYAERAWKELEAAAAFKDWNPRHFLDTAEMTHAFAIGYDWLYDYWKPEQRDLLRASMVEKGIKLANDIQSKNTWWAKAHHNWNQVCNGGIGMGALALADVEPAVSGEFLHAALKSIQLAMREYGPDGAWAEGPGYWHYATSYNVVFLAALQTALGRDFGLGEIPGFADAGLFPMYATGPLGRTFNYADGGDGTIRAPEMLWLARRFNRPAYARYQVPIASGTAQDLIWYDPQIAQATAPASPLDEYFRGAEVVTLRSAWNDKDAVFVGFKGGDNQANHSHLDLGTFVLDALGVRWAVDLGADDYNLPAYFGNKRWTYYRLRTEGHNTLDLNPGAAPGQNPAAAAKIIQFESTPNRAVAVADLSAAYAQQARSVRRGIALLDRRRVLVQDEIQADQAADLWWFLHTPAEIEVATDGKSATLQRDGKRLRAQLIVPAEAMFSVMDAKPLPNSPQPEGQNANQGIRRLAIHLPKAESVRLAVLLQPLAQGQGSSLTAPELRPLAEW